MSVHQSLDNIEEFHTICNSHFDIDSNIELLEYPRDDNSLQSTSGIAHPNMSSSRARLCVQFWARVRNLFVDWWMGELLAIVLSLATFGLLVFILYKYDGQHLPTLFHNLSLTFVVSILATTSKSLLLLTVASAIGQFKWLWIFTKQSQLQDLQIFDEASRGPLGAFKQLTSKKIL